MKPATQRNNHTDAPRRKGGQADAIHRSLEQRIIEGELANGTRLDEVSLAAGYGVSRTPLREALQRLAGSGLVEMLPRRGVFVRHPGLTEIVEMFEVMAELEAMCGRLAARRLSAEELAALSRAALACERAMSQNDPDAYYAENEIFHQLIYQGSHNSFLAAEALRLQKRLRTFRRLQLRARGRLEQSMNEHAAILKALEAGEAAAADLLRQHVVIQGEKFHNLLVTYERAIAEKQPGGKRNAKDRKTAK